MIRNPFHEIGRELGVFGLRHAEQLLPWVLPSLLFALVVFGLLFFRSLRAGRRLAYSHPWAFRSLHHPWLAPSLGIALGFALFVAAPYWAAGMDKHRPSEWPGWGGLPLETSLDLVSSGGILVLWGSITLLLRSLPVKRPRTERSSAQWSRWSEIRPAPDWRWTIPIKIHYRGSFQPWRTGAGANVFTLRESEVARHILLVGQTGSGKGFTVFGPIIESSKTPIVYQDVKGQAPGRERIKERLGIDPILWGCAAHGGWSSLGWNAMEECRQEGFPTAAFNALAAALIPGRGEEDWVAQLARPILSWTMEHGEFGNLGHLQDALTMEGMDVVISRARVPKGLVLALQGKNVREYLGTTIFSSLACFGSGWGREVTSCHDFTLKDVCERGAYVLSAEPERHLRTPLTVFWRLLLRRLQRSSEKVPLTLLFDEALAAGRIPDVQDLLVTIRDRDVSVIFGTQHLSGLRQVYGRDEGDSLIASFASRIWLLSALDHRDRKELVEELGTRVIFETRGRGAHAQVVPVDIPLLGRADLNLRANQSGAFWAVIESPSLLGHPTVCRMVGGPEDLIQRPPQNEVMQRRNLYAPAPTTPPLLIQGRPPAEVQQAIEGIQEACPEKDPWD